MWSRCASELQQAEPLQRSEAGLEKIDINIVINGNIVTNIADIISGLEFPLPVTDLTKSPENMFYVIGSLGQPDEDEDITHS